MIFKLEYRDHNTNNIFTTKQTIPNTSADAAPRYQVLEPRDGYVPVYIRLGDQPLADINPELAAAFREPVARISRAELAQVLYLRANINKP